MSPNPKQRIRAAFLGDEWKFLKREAEFMDAFNAAGASDFARLCILGDNLLKKRGAAASEFSEGQDRPK